jgi:ABC-type bacteriocin/lantibiotic exporter with double-glycine peptidase domain
MPKIAINQQLTRLWSHINPRRRLQLGFLFLVMVLASFAEIFSIGAVLPFLAALTDPGRLYEHAALQPLIRALGITAPSQLLLPLTVLFGVAAISAGAMRLLLLWASTRLSFATGADITISIYRRTLYQNYLVHCARNSSEVIAGISGKANSVISSVIFPILNLVSSGLMLIMILFALVMVEPMIALSAFCGFGLIYFFIVRLTSKQLQNDSRCIANESVQVIKCLQEGMGGIRDILIDGSQETYCQIFRDADIRLRRAQGNQVFISGSPRYGIEALGMLLIAVLAYILAQKSNGINQAIPILGALALGSQRLLPALQQAYAARVSIRGGSASLQDVLDFLDQPMPDYAEKTAAKPIRFNHIISLKQLGFRYTPQSSYVLSGIDLSIPKGSRVGFIGTTGSGKTTLLDIVMGLLQPTDGGLQIDGQAITPGNRRAWQAHIAHVPQTIYLADTTIEENIAFGVPKGQISYSRVRQAAEQAQIAESIESWPQKYQTQVGERGICLSGGQRQRIGIARALYKQADVIIFDEATSALDNETERAVMKSIECLGKDYTILIIAHRLTTLKNCAQIVELEAGGIKRSCSYQEIVIQTEFA